MPAQKQLKGGQHVAAALAVNVCPLPGIVGAIPVYAEQAGDEELEGRGAGGASALAHGSIKASVRAFEQNAGRNAIFAAAEILQDDETSAILVRAPEHRTLRVSRMGQAIEFAITASQNWRSGRPTECTQIQELLEARPIRQHAKEDALVGVISAKLLIGNAGDPVKAS